jgi:hypothetical protein
MQVKSKKGSGGNANLDDGVLAAKTDGKSIPDRYRADGDSEFGDGLLGEISSVAALLLPGAIQLVVGPPGKSTLCTDEAANAGKHLRLTGRLVGISLRPTMD